MSINFKQSVKCPKCGQMSAVTVWSSITAREDPDLKEDLLRGRINIFRCPSCTQTGLMPSPLLYHDEDGRLLVSFSPCADRETARRLFENVKKSSEESGELKKFEGYNLRFVTDFNELLEKILIFDNGLNDKAVEIIKLMILSQEPERSGRRSCRFGKLEGDIMEFMIADTEENQIYTSSVPLKTYDIIWKSLRESGCKPYSFSWERVDAEYASRLMQGFNNPR